VYWAARNIGPLPIANHHFIVLVTSKDTVFNDTLPFEIETSTWRTNYFFIVAGFKLGGDENLQAVLNPKNDVLSFRQLYYPENYTNITDFQFEMKRVVPPNNMNDTEFVNFIFQLTKNYADNGGTKYDLRDDNCATWVNTVMWIAGITDTHRMELGQFCGIDWGQQKLLDPYLFLVNNETGESLETYSSSISIDSNNETVSNGERGISNDSLRNTAGGGFIPDDDGQSISSQPNHPINRLITLRYTQAILTIIILAVSFR
jgi:hypothetical protein